MPAATLTFGVTDLAMSKVAEAKASPHVPKGLASFIVKAFGSYLSGYVEKKSRHMAELAIWFNGAVVTLANERSNAHVDLDDKLVPALEDMQASLLEMRSRILGLIAEFPVSNSRVVGALRSAAHSAADLHEAASHFKWALMEQDADLDVSRGNFEVFEDAGSLLASLKH